MNDELQVGDTVKLTSRKEYDDWWHSVRPLEDSYSDSFCDKTFRIHTITEGRATVYSVGDNGWGYLPCSPPLYLLKKSE